MSDKAISRPMPQYTGELVAEREDKGTMLLRRWAGAWIDFVALAALSLGPLFAAGSSSLSLQRTGLVLGLVLFLAYFPVTEAVWGRTLGKLITGTIVVDRDGEKAGFGKVIVRTLMRLVEVNPFLAGGIPAGVCVLVTKGKQRLGDMAAGTYVVSVKALRAAQASAEVF
jgi:uncharacterized RDD family membrane protein YckC